MAHSTHPRQREESCSEKEKQTDGIHLPQNIKISPPNSKVPRFYSFFFLFLLKSENTKKTVQSSQ